MLRPHRRLANRLRRRVGVSVAVAIAAATTGAADTSRPQPSAAARSPTGRDSLVWPLADTHGLTLMGLAADPVTYRGRLGLHVTRAAGFNEGAFGRVALLDKTRFRNGTIELEVAGLPSADADTSDRGFVGLVFRSASDGSRFESFYIRATNGRASDPLRRKHAVQYQSSPDFPWYRLRQETPLRYEGYTDLDAGAWTPIRVVVRGTRAELFVNNATQPCLVVPDLKLGDAEGAVGLWVGPGTDAHFRHLTIVPDDSTHERH